MIKKYFLQILIVLLLFAIAGVLLSLNEDKRYQGISENQPIQANINQSIGDRNTDNIDSEFFPMRNWLIDEPEIPAKAAIIVNLKNTDSRNIILYQKNINDILPIASLTKIMTAIIALENFDLEEIIEVSEKSVTVTGDNGGLIRDEELKVKDLLSIMLMESSNDAAMALAEDNPRMDYDEFIDLMNSKAKELELRNTAFIDPVGLSPDNKSTVIELAKLTEYALKFPLLLEILKTAEKTIFSIDNRFVHNLVNTNKLLGKIPQIIGGKTGFTEEAGGCMLTVSLVNNSDYLISIVLSSTQRENDIENLINWVEKAWLWQ